MKVIRIDCFQSFCELNISIEIVGFMIITSTNYHNKAYYLLFCRIYIVFISVRIQITVTTFDENTQD